MAVLTVSVPPQPLISLCASVPTSSSSRTSASHLAGPFCGHRRQCVAAVASQLCETPAVLAAIDRFSLNVAEAETEDELLAAAWLRIRSFYVFRESFGIEAHKQYKAECEFEALKERVAGQRMGFKRVSCINATLPLSQIKSLSDDLCTKCKFSDKGEDRVVVGTLDLNQCLRLPDELTGLKPKGIGADFARAYLSNVCVAKELHRNGLGYAIIAKAKMLAENWGISDLYVHVAVDNEPAKNLYLKSGFIYESEEPAWQSRFLDRPRRMLLWTKIPNNLELE